MYGAILGDLIGSVYEYDQYFSTTEIWTSKLLKDNSFYSDDTILTIAILDAILNDKDYEKYLKLYIDKYKDYKPDFNPYFESAFSPNLINWSSSKEIGESCGNGAMMRISPVGYMFDNEQEVVSNARLATIPSHNSLEAINCATTIALIIFYARLGMPKADIFKQLDINVKYNEFMKFNKTCNETINNCLYAIYATNSFDDAMRLTLMMGGDTDTNCCIVGSMAEAMYGIPDEYIEEVNSRIPDEFVKVLEKNKK